MGIVSGHERIEKPPHVRSCDPLSVLESVRDSILRKNEIRIRPAIVDGLDYAEGKITTIYGVIEVSYVKREKEIEFVIHCDERISPTLEYGGRVVPVSSGERIVVERI